MEKISQEIIKPAVENFDIKKSRPVEKLIPGIKPPKISLEEQLDLSKSRYDSSLSNSFAEFLIKKLLLTQQNFGEEDLLKVKNIFRDQVVVDLGAGDEGDGYLVSQILEAQSYVAVELYHDAELRSLLEDLNAFKIQIATKAYDLSKSQLVRAVPGLCENKIPFAIEKNDMLTFLQRLPDESVSIIMSGIDTSIIRSPYVRENIMHEIQRVVSNKGGFMCNCNVFEKGEGEKIFTPVFNDSIMSVYKRKDLNQE